VLQFGFLAPGLNDTVTVRGAATPQSRPSVL
jgi:hypothetical protein